VPLKRVSPLCTAVMPVLTMPDRARSAGSASAQSCSRSAMSRTSCSEVGIGGLQHCAGRPMQQQDGRDRQLLVSCGTRSDDRRATSASFDAMALISGQGMRLADAALDGVVEQVSVLV
jgi:hypothetical protein